jgi:hypothetical protein
MRRHSAVLITAAMVLVSLTPAVATPAVALPQVATALEHTSAKVILDWDGYAVEAVRHATTMDGVAVGMPARPFYQTEGLLYMSYVQAAVYDAVMKIDGRYVLYHDFAAQTHGASASAAAISAAYNTLLAYLGDPKGELKKHYDDSVAALPEEGRAAGIMVGKAASDDIVGLRANDGRNAVITKTYGTGPLAPGLWVFAPKPSLQSAQTPWVAFMKPLLLKKSSQFRLDEPPELDSRRWVTDFNEVKAYGASASMVRSTEQTNVAQFWNANGINQANDTASNVSKTHGMDLVDTARLLAMTNLVVTDALIACFDSKYEFTFWRPVTAIQNAQIAGNPATTADPKWTPLLLTPNHPEYPAAHGCDTAASSEVFAAVLGTRHINIDVRGAVGGATTLTTTRHYSTVETLQTEIVNARVWAGLHYRTSGQAGVELGRDVARWALQRFFLPASESEEG